MAERTSGEALYTLEEFIRLYETEDLKISDLFLQDVFPADNGNSNKKIILNDTALTDKYLEELRPSVAKVSFNTQEYVKYKYNPKLLSYEVYGTTELWYLILRINELYTAADFDLRVVKMFDVSVLDKITRMMDLETPFMDLNADEVQAKLNE